MISYSLLTSSDVDECAELYILTYKEKPWSEEWNSSQPIKTFIRTHLQNNFFKGFIMKINEQIIGVCIGFQKPWPMGIEYYIDEFFIHPAFQGKGFGKKFMTEIEKYCLNDGLNAILLNTQKGYKSETFYKNNGFSEHNGLIILSKDL